MDESKTYTEAQIRSAHELAESLAAELDWNLRDEDSLTDYMNVVFNGFWSILKDPDREWSLDDVLNANWQEDEYYDTAADMVRAWH